MMKMKKRIKKAVLEKRIRQLDEIYFDYDKVIEIIL